MTNIREKVLETSKEIVTHDRNSQYGEPENGFSIIADLWNCYLSDVLNDSIKSYDVAAMMALLKVARIRINPKKMDNWIDLAGYSACGAECASKEE